MVYTKERFSLLVIDAQFHSPETLECLRYISQSPKLPKNAFSNIAIHEVNFDGEFEVSHTEDYEDMQVLESYPYNPILEEKLIILMEAL